MRLATLTKCMSNISDIQFRYAVEHKLSLSDKTEKELQVCAKLFARRSGEYTETCTLIPKSSCDSPVFQNDVNMAPTGAKIVNRCDPAVRIP